MHSMIKQDWAAAINTLKPSRKELDRGLKLHAESVVFDAYALGIYGQGSRDWDSWYIGAVEKKIQEGASFLELADFAEEMGQLRNLTDKKAWDYYRYAFKTSGVTCIFQNAGQERQDSMRLLRRITRHTLITDFRKDFVRKAASPDDIIKAKKENRHALYFMCNEVPLPQRWESAQSELDLIHLFFQLGIRMMHLTYNRRNMIGDGCGESANSGLSDFGRAVISEMNRTGVIVDVAHSGWLTSKEAAMISCKPVVASHSGCAALNNHYRCKPDDVIKAIADSGGYIGICCIGRFLGGDCSIKSLLDHIKYAVKKFGADHVAIGTDRKMPHSGNIIPPVENFPRGRKGWAGLWPPASSPVDFEKISGAAPTLAWTNWPIFTVGLVQKGFKDADIRKIIGENVMRVAKEVLSESAFIRY